MPNFICITCGVQFGTTAKPPSDCPICQDERQFVRHGGQAWTTLQNLASTHINEIVLQETDLYGISTKPSFAIGQQALLIQSDYGNLLWDCISHIDDQTVAQIEQLGGIRNIAISHPHFYASAVEWAQKFDATIYLHQADAKWVMRPSPRIHFWKEPLLALQPDITLIQTGGHFSGSTVCHWSPKGDSSKRLLTGDSIHVAADRRWVTFMRSYPNLIPLSASNIQQIVQALEPFPFDRLYGAWPSLVVKSGAKEAVIKSADRYVRAFAAR